MRLVPAVSAEHLDISSKSISKSKFCFDKQLLSQARGQAGHNNSFWENLLPCVSLLSCLRNFCEVSYAYSSVFVDIPNILLGYAYVQL